MNLKNRIDCLRAAIAQAEHDLEIVEQCYPGKLPPNCKAVLRVVGLRAELARLQDASGINIRGRTDETATANSRGGTDEESGQSGHEQRRDHGGTGEHRG